MKRPPTARSRRNSAAQPPPHSKSPADFVQLSWQRYKTNGATYSGFNMAKMSGGRISSVSRDAAIGAIVFEVILYYKSQYLVSIIRNKALFELLTVLTLAPSIATVLERPFKPNFAAE